MVAWDLAEVLGAAVALQLLFEIPLPAGVMVTAADTLVVLWLNQYRIRTLETMIVRLIVIVAACVGVEILMAKPDVLQVAAGMRPRLDRDSLFASIAILGATVMPHNLFLHSSLVQTRRIGPGAAAIRSACRHNLWDTLVALNTAMFVNIAILAAAAATFWQRGIAVTEIGQAAEMLGSLLGSKTAVIAFAVALLCVGQASTLTGAMAGQIVMEGFLNIRLRPWLRRLITRVLALVPAVATASLTGESGVYQLLLISQVALCIQLPFAVVPLVRFTGDRNRMGE